ncbi:7-deoxyloganetic acid glucosyltransferase [Thalictrum thalictroides]|uniref:7-deoxyloganetic acid glucosyltransferase n=1 Tax=Thalictrum thalictroides TaxID=46969 RepID=A0A7J6VB95_THATH|nr:7-deoxyloganetic acid glucosyltransferase [Thalictrum thalictroides]
MRPHFPKLYTLGPLHALLSTVHRNGRSSSSNNSIFEVDRDCITWLDSQPSKSVVYVSFGSIVMMTHKQMLEFWYGLVNSGKRFLWAIRPDSVIDKDEKYQIPHELTAGTEQRGFVSEVWKVGLDMKDTSDRSTIENMVNDLMDTKRDELMKSMDETSQLAKKSVSEGGSSYFNLEALIKDINAL